jgi:hypothetical protein
LTIPNPKSKQKTQLTAFNDDNNRSNLSELELGHGQLLQQIKQQQKLPTIDDILAEEERRILCDLESMEL